MDTFISKSAGDTFELGRRWGEGAAAGWIIGLTGDLGSGKTQLAKGIAAGLGVSGRVLSPTFALVHEYEARLPMYHLDLYRLNSIEEVSGAGLESYLCQREGVSVVEWVERIDPRLAAVKDSVAGGLELSRWALRYRQVWLETASETERRITYEDFGA